MTKIDKMEQSKQFWKECYPEGMSSVDIDNELHDFYILIGNIPEIYMQVTCGKVSKHLTDADVIISLYEENVTNMINEDIKDALEDFVSGLDIDTLSGILETADLSEHQRIALRNTVYELEKHREQV